MMAACQTKAIWPFLTPSIHWGYGANLCGRQRVLIRLFLERRIKIEGLRALVHRSVAGYWTRLPR